MGKVNYEKIENILKSTTKLSPTELSRLSKETLSTMEFARILRYYDFDPTNSIGFIIGHTNRNERSVKSSFYRFLGMLKKNKINIARIKNATLEAVAKKKRKAEQTQEILDPSPKTVGESSDKAIKKLSKVLDFFSIHSKKTLDQMELIANGRQLTSETLIGEYKELFTILMAQAKGEVVTRKTQMKYTIDDKGQKIPAKNLNGEVEMFETTQSLPPDTRAFGGALIVLEVIQSMEGKNNYIGKDALDEMYSEFLDETERKKVIGLERASRVDF